jgi:phage terminase large subunit-like protein
VASRKINEDQRAERRTLAETDFEEFIRLVQPKRCLANCHIEAIRFITSEGSHKLVLLPREHQKSTLAGLWTAWRLTKDPTLRILYISSTSNLATKQLKFIKDILTSATYSLYWPDMVNKEEAKREQWTQREISLDHPARKEAYIRDPSIFTAGLTSNIVGLHCDIAVMDDVVVESNAYIEEGRDKVKNQYSLLSSVESANAEELVVGTRYHPKDLYNDLIEMEIEKHDELGNVMESTPLFKVLQREVESVGDGSGEYLWPRQQGTDAKWYGFNQEILAKKRLQYLNKVHFRAQYYNNPNDDSTASIKRECFQYYDPQYLGNKDGRWFFKGERLNIVAAVDFAYSTAKKADYTSIVVVGINGSNEYFVLDIDRFKSDKISDYYDHILKLHQKWGFRKIRAEVSVAQAVIVKDLKENYIRPNGLALAVEEFRPSRWQGSKEERIMATLEPRYANRQMWHYRHGNCQQLEEELVFSNPAHDDIKDALASAVDFIQAPTFNVINRSKEPMYEYHARFGGVV